MSPSSRSRLTIVCACLCLFYSGLFVYLASQHIGYPGFTEPMEGDILQHVERAAKGLPIYPKPGADFIALPYMPVFYFVSAPVYWLLGDTFAVTRLVATVSAFLTGMLLILIGRRETGAWAGGLLTGALFFAGYRVMDAYLTCGMPDSMYTFWLIAGYYFWAYGRTKAHDVVWLLCFGLAFWTKQHGAVYFACAVAYAFLFRKNALQRWTILTGLLLLGPIAYLLIGQSMGDGFFHHTFVIPGRWERGLHFALRRTAFMVAGFVPMLSLLTWFYLRASVSWKERRCTPLAWFVVSGLVCSMITMMASGSSNNHYIPFLAILAVSAVAGAQLLANERSIPRLTLVLASFVVSCTVLTYAAQHMYHTAFIQAPAVSVLLFASYLVIRRFGSPDWGAAAVAVVLLVAQISSEAFNPKTYLPPEGFERAVAEVQEIVRASDGQLIWAPYGNAPASTTGVKLLKAPSYIAMMDIERQLNTPDAMVDLEPFLNQIHESSKLFVLADYELKTVEGWSHLASEFTLEKDFGDRMRALRQIVPHWFGGSSYPRYLYRHNPSSQAAKLTGPPRQP